MDPIRQTHPINFTLMGLGYLLIIHRLTVDNVQFVGTCSFRKLTTGGTDKKKVPTNLITTTVSEVPIRSASLLSTVPPESTGKYELARSCYGGSSDVEQ